MIKKTITYTDYEGKERTEDFYFNLSQAELLEKELVHYKTGFGEYLQRIIDSDDGRQIMDVFKAIIKDSYGIRTEDGKSFIKTEDAYNKFVGTEAYSQLFTDLVTKADVASEFVRGLLPANLAAKAAEAEAKAGFRPGAQTLPKSRLEQLAEQAAERAKAEEAAAEIHPNEVMQANDSSGYQETEVPETNATREPTPEELQAAWRAQQAQQQ